MTYGYTAGRPVTKIPVQLPTVGLAQARPNKYVCHTTKEFRWGAPVLLTSPGSATTFPFSPPASLLSLLPFLTSCTYPLSSSSHTGVSMASMRVFEASL